MQTYIRAVCKTNYVAILDIVHHMRVQHHHTIKETIRFSSVGYIYVSNLFKLTNNV